MSTIDIPGPRPATKPDMLIITALNQAFRWAKRWKGYWPVCTFIKHSVGYFLINYNYTLFAKIDSAIRSISLISQSSHSGLNWSFALTSSHMHVGHEGQWILMLISRRVEQARDTAFVSDNPLSLVFQHHVLSACLGVYFFSPNVP